jgi:hypothetical protein
LFEALERLRCGMAARGLQVPGHGEIGAETGDELAQQRLFLVAGADACCARVSGNQHG